MIQWIEEKINVLLVVISLLIGLVWWSQKQAVNGYEQKVRKDADKRYDAAKEAARNVDDLPDDVVNDSMRRENWFRD